MAQCLARDALLGLYSSSGSASPNACRALEEAPQDRTPGASASIEPKVLSCAPVRVWINMQSLR